MTTPWYVVIGLTVGALVALGGLTVGTWIRKWINRG